MVKASLLYFVNTQVAAIPDGFIKSGIQNIRLSQPDLCGLKLFPASSDYFYPNDICNR